MSSFQLPVRLSTLLPYIPLLMEPLISSLSGHYNSNENTTSRGDDLLEGRVLD